MNVSKDSSGSATKGSYEEKIAKANLLCPMPESWSPDSKKTEWPSSSSRVLAYPLSPVLGGNCAMLGKYGIDLDETRKTSQGNSQIVFAKNVLANTNVALKLFRSEASADFERERWMLQRLAKSEYVVEMQDILDAAAL